MSAEYPPWATRKRVIVNCQDCTAECCKHISIHIDAPKTWSDFQDLAEYVQYEHVNVYKDNDNDWVVEFKTRCGQLDGNRCMAFKRNKQPMTCREYNVTTCVMNQPSDYWKILFDTPKDVATYAKKTGIRKPIAIVKKRRCSSECCNHLSVGIDEPEDWRDFDDIRWYVAHQNVSAFKDSDGDWMVRFDTPQKSRCSTCEQQRCKNDVHDYEVLFTCMEDVESFLEKKGISRPLKGKSTLKLTSY